MAVSQGQVKAFLGRTGQDPAKMGRVLLRKVASEVSEAALARGPGGPAPADGGEERAKSAVRQAARLVAMAPDTATLMPLLTEEGKRLVGKEHAKALVRAAAKSIGGRGDALLAAANLKPTGKAMEAGKALAKARERGAVRAGGPGSLVEMTPKQQAEFLSPKFSQRILALTRMHGPRAIETIVDLLDSEDDRSRLGAAALLLDRGFGKALVTESEAARDPRAMHLEALRAVAAGAAAGAAAGVLAGQGSMAGFGAAFVAGRQVLTDLAAEQMVEAKAEAATVVIDADAADAGVAESVEGEAGQLASAATSRETVGAAAPPGDDEEQDEEPGQQISLGVKPG